MLRPEEVEMLVCGSPTLDLNELRKVTEYDGYRQDHPTIKYVFHSKRRRGRRGHIRSIWKI